MEKIPVTARHIGIVACSAEGAALCYRTICLEAGDRMGRDNHPEITMHTFPLEKYMVPIRRGDWREVGRLMLESTCKVAQTGAAFAICPDNTIHQALPLIQRELPIPWIHIADAVGREAIRRGYKRLGLTGTKYLVSGPVYPDVLAAIGLQCERPTLPQRDRIDEIIFRELVQGRIEEPSRLYFNEVIADFRSRGCDAVVLGCTEIPLLVKPNDCPLPTLDSTRLLARAAIAAALEE